MSLYDFPVTSLDGHAGTLAPWRGQVLLVVNVASRCGFTPQYAGLETLWRRHRDRGFAVLGFPCDQFGHQEPGDADEIRAFCTARYDVTFPMFAKVAVNGAHADPLWKHLRAECPGFLGFDAVPWNFTKFLVDRAGRVTARYGPTDAPERIERALLPLLDAPLPEAA
ncbi:glutathione peroxidase [Roseisolibacter sp. H3M3-2]|uniref:glutathione peroxidase n=1 Tax=Roseisolibacter sp. H3M3-2 TaxID=3031323 RepID=UPI0023DCD960|nr:glutathione peroxidase [Roseisolibacter sp. H3M3-2]MDF1503986.1 glutathione peroxidase [Roseisolibacter sp. H3M3-2]